MKKLLVLFALVLGIGAWSTSSAAAQDATIMLVHGIPDTDVDVLVDGEPAIEGFQFGDMQDLSALAGQTLVDLQVVLAGTDTVAIAAGDVELPASGNWSVIAYLDADGTPTLGVFENDTAPTAAGEGRLTVRHTAAAPAVDVLANGAVAFSNLPNGAEATADLPAGVISAEVVPAGASEPVVIGPAELPIDEGQLLVVYAVGSLEQETITVLTQTVSGLASAPSAVNTGNSPISDGGDAFPAWTLAAAGGAALLAAGAIGLRTAAARARS